jgi:hypothetical protein
MVDLLELGQGQFGHPGPGIDQYVVVHQHRGGLQRATNATTTAENSDLHV